MRNIFYPDSIAVIGVSTSVDNMGLGIIYNLIEFGFRGTIYEVGPKGGEVAGRQIYKSVLDIPNPVDLAVILTPARTVADILDECGQKGILWAVVESSGFREYGEEGKKFEEKIIQVAEKWGTRFVGPNCLGVINLENGLCTPFTPLKHVVRLGDISMISQSGGVGMSVLNLMGNEGLGLNKFVSAGNMLNIQTEEFLEYLIEDPATNYIYLHLEGIQNGRKLMEVARKSPKPILASKANIGQFGKSIASSHTASLSSNDRVVDAAFRQCGIIRINDGTTLGNDLKILHLPPMRGRNLAIISRSGGHAVIAADVCEIVGFKLAPFPKEFIEEIEKHFRASVIKLTNPLDLGDLFDSDFFLRIIDRTLAEDGVDGIVFLHTIIPMIEGQKSRELLARITDLSKQYGKPVAVYVSTEDQEVAWLKRNLNYPIFTQIVETIRALELNRRYYAEIEQTREPKKIDSFLVNKEMARPLLEKAKKEKRDLFLNEAGEVLNVYGIPMIQGIPVPDEGEAIKAAKQLGFPVAMKIISKEVSHKSNVGGVQLNLRTEAGVADAYRDMLKGIYQAYPEAKIEGVLIQPMAVGGRELIIGGRQDEQFGPVVLVGLGGIFVEIFGEVSLRVAPITPREAMEMINELRGIAMFKGARGSNPSDLEAVAEVLLRLSQLLCDLPEIREIDINPLRVFLEKQGCLGLDVRMILDKS
ncbi:MAG TPA: acetate--CoA ligase family protein [Thermodesulfobacteriota bacterium]|jgi:acetyltransferase|nr:acetate--CoA ligase family protein [Thermodesulfobacteriota bacterium]